MKSGLGRLPVPETTISHTALDLRRLRVAACDALAVPRILQPALDEARRYYRPDLLLLAARRSAGLPRRRGAGGR
jgi:hypothetical protein